MLTELRAQLEAAAGQPPPIDVERIMVRARRRKARRRLIAGAVSVACVMGGLALAIGMSKDMVSTVEVGSDPPNQVSLSTTAPVSVTVQSRPTWPTYPAGPVVVPDLVGLLLREAEERARRSGVAVSRKVQALPPGSPEIGRVIAQDPPPGQQVAGGSLVKLTITRSSAAAPAAGAPLCDHVAYQRQLRGADVTEPDAIAVLVSALPEALRLDAALFYSPYGGSIPPGADTSGNAAQAAGERLSAYYRATCGFDDQS